MLLIHHRHHLTERKSLWPIAMQKLSLSRLIHSTIVFHGFDLSEGETQFPLCISFKRVIVPCRAFVYLTNLLYGIPLVQNVAIVSECGEVKGYLKIAVQQLQTSDTADEQIKLMRTYRNASGMTKIAFDDETYFQVSSSIEFSLLLSVTSRQ